MMKKARAIKAKKANRRAKAARRYSPSMTPTHFVRLSRPRIEIDHARRWYVVRTMPQQERATEAALKEAGFTTCLAVNEVVAVRPRRSVAVQEIPAIGYVFVGFEEGQDGREALWIYHDTIVASMPPLTVVDEAGQEIAYRMGLGAQRPFVRVFGPFKARQLQDFIDKLNPPSVEVLWDKAGPVAIFPSRITAIMGEQEVLLSPAVESPLAESENL